MQASVVEAEADLIAEHFQGTVRRRFRRVRLVGGVKGTRRICGEGFRLAGSSRGE